MSTGFIVLEHDLFQQAVDVATGYILPDALAHNPPFTIKSVVNCLNKPPTDAYIETNDNKTSPPAGPFLSFSDKPQLIFVFAGKGPVTLSSGAPGSAQATGVSSHSSASSLSVPGSSTILHLLVVAATGLLGTLLL